ncbi:MAG: MogA/MoaB family molybdenum cofactor biosynthesis protein [Phycisphaerales bacterium]|nr:MogA/MoaB family molybdenum cofactor biosynthesis protein [Phycisphaerales bacterium]
MPIRAAVLTVSDRCSRGEAVDTSGPALASLLRERLGADVVLSRCLPDEIPQVAACFREWSRPEARIDLVVSTGGTGLAPRDVTPEAARSVFDREHNGLMELARMRCYASTPRTYLSRGVAGTVARTLILTLPGSLRGSTEMLEALLDILPHAIETLRGEVQDDGRAEATPATGRVISHRD